MQKYPLLTAATQIDPGTECRYRYIYGANDIFYPHTHDYYEIFITLSGTVTHLVNGEVQKLPEGTLVFIRPHDVHGYLYENSESRSTAYINLTFTVETAELLFQYLSDGFPSQKLLSCDLPPAVTLNPFEKERLFARISELNLVNWQDKNALKLRMRTILADIFVRFFYDLPNKSDDGLPRWLAELKTEMEQTENFVYGLDRMVELSRKSREHLARSMKKYCGMTTAEYINELRINYASNLLLHTNTPILEICYSCGFQSASYFYGVFKRKYGVSPNGFRKLHKQ